MKSSLASIRSRTGCPPSMLNRSPGTGDDPLDEVGVRLLGLWLVARLAVPRRAFGSPHVSLSAPPGGWKTTMSPISRVAEVVDDAIDQHPLPRVQSGLHRARRDLVRLDDEGLDQQRQADRQRDDHHQLEERAEPGCRLRISAVPRRMLGGCPRIASSSEASAPPRTSSEAPAQAPPPDRRLVRLPRSFLRCGCPAGLDVLGPCSALCIGLGRDRRLGLALGDALGVDRLGSSSAIMTSSSSIPQRRSATLARLPTRPRR